MPSKTPTPVILAAGGVVWRPSAGGIEVAVVHRPRYDDWSLPKGKLEPGESELAAAVREVDEELGSRVAVSRWIRRIRYRVGPSQKQVAFWSMRHLDGRFTADAEVDDMKWLRTAEAHEMLSYDYEQDVLADFAALPVPESVIVLVRHAKAGKRSNWDGDDNLRPLDSRGRKQASALADYLPFFAPDRIVVAQPLRCRQTVQPLAEKLGMEITVEAMFSDEMCAENPTDAYAALAALAKPGRTTVVCSQGDTIPAMIEHFAPYVRDPTARKGSVWVLAFVDGTVVSADYYPDAAG